jgi:CubicO group peptidase (beta-lactamase class C family)
VFAIAALPGQAQNQLSADVQARIDQIAHEVLSSTDVPSASVAVVKDGRLVYRQAYGDARMDPHRPAMPSMRYSVGSISKQFTATAILLLAEAGKLSLDDPVSRFVPDLTRAKDVTIRQLLSHTSGYQDYYPQDYTPKMMTEPVSAERIMDLCARKPLDFEPGSRWQYSNTNYVIAGVIAEKAGGKPLVQFLRERIFGPLGMQSVTDIDQQPLSEPDPEGYVRFALGPARPAPREGKGWLFAAGELAMSAEDLAKWDVSMIEKKILKPASYRQMQTDVLLSSGVASGYGLGLFVGSAGGRRTLSHGGEVSGFTASNTVFPDDRAAIIVLTNQDAARAAGEIEQRITPLVFAMEDASSKSITDQARKIFEGLQHGSIDRSLLTENASAYFSEQALKDFADSLAPLGMPQEFTQTSTGLRGGMTLRVYAAKFAKRTLRVWTYALPDGKLEQYQVATQ